MNRQPLHVAMAVAPDLRPRAGAGHERIVRRHAAVVVQPDDLAVMVGQILRRVRLEIAFGRHLPIAERQEQEPVPVERDLAAEVTAALRHGLEQLLDVGQPIVLEAAADRAPFVARLSSAPGFE